MNAKLKLAEQALRRIALNISGDTVAQVVAGECLDALVALPAPAPELAKLRKLPDARVPDLSRLVARLMRELKKADPAHELPMKAMDYLNRHNLIGSPLRTTSAGDECDPGAWLSATQALMPDGYERVPVVAARQPLAIPPGWRLAPIEPTGVMKDCGASALPLSAGNPWNAGTCYRAMLAAAPKPTEAA